MKKTISLLALGSLLSFSADAQLKDLLNKAKEQLPVKTGTGTGSNLSNTEIVSGLRQALELGSKNASGMLSKKDGYFGNAVVKILLPPEARKVETVLRQIGMGHLADETILSMNRAAEDAAQEAAPIFLNAIRTMSIQDGVSILRGGKGAATNYLKRRTTVELTNAFRPVIENSLNKMNVAGYWNKTFSTYNRLPTTRQAINPDLAGYVTERALAGLFLMIAEEENKIRTDPGARVTDLLKKVFGG